MASHGWVCFLRAVLSTYNAFVARRKDTSHVVVTVDYGFLTFGNLSEEIVLISAANPSHHPLTLTSVGFKLPDNRTLALVEPQGTAPTRIMPS
jgi:hypothetical protein